MITRLLLQNIRCTNRGTPTCGQLPIGTVFTNITDSWRRTSSQSSVSRGSRHCTVVEVWQVILVDCGCLHCLVLTHQPFNLQPDSSHARTNPFSLRRCSFRPSEVAIPAASCPRCCRIVKPSYNSCETRASRFAKRMPMTPHMVGASVVGAVARHLDLESKRCSLWPLHQRPRFPQFAIIARGNPCCPIGSWKGLRLLMKDTVVILVCAHFMEHFLESGLLRTGTIIERRR